MKQSELNRKFYGHWRGAGRGLQRLACVLIVGLACVLCAVITALTWAEKWLLKKQEKQPEKVREI